eukprot:CAMPEP_0183810726 /NCGR_PEP_ID=MMETSP0803_2-20130417/47964_1 /TAXON_ID=195967 /ORGANISM="Crustomastix stigmata, Strain CCMP3273" /LENGTH=257 /DNA_ID=CAMNT_0026055545 /DNA_START=70 /DNA_END=839 /DNA_ORIENTATION=+
MAAMGAGPLFVPVFLEACVEGPDSAVAAQEGGAARLELCAASALTGGLTPSHGVIKAVRASVSLPLNVLVRPRPGDFVYSQAELQSIQEDLVAAKELGADGVVLGLLTPQGTVDEGRLLPLVSMCHTLQLGLTFHRAFDKCRDLPEALEALVRCGVPCVLTSGGAPTAAEGCEAIARLVAQAAGRISVMAGGGVSEENVGALVQGTGVAFVHASCSEPVQPAGPEFNARVRFSSAGYERRAASAQRVAAIAAASRAG